MALQVFMEELVRLPPHAGRQFHLTNFLEVAKHTRTSAEAESSNAKDSSWTALYMAAQQGHCDRMELLIKAGADVNSSTADGCTAMHASAHEGFSQCCELLFQVRDPLTIL